MTGVQSDIKENQAYICGNAEERCFYKEIWKYI